MSRRSRGRRSSPDDVLLEAVLLQYGASVTRDDVAVALGGPLIRIDCALATLHQRLTRTGARLHPVGIDGYVVAPNHRALTVEQWVQLGQSRSGHATLTPAAATALYKLFAAQAELSWRASRRRSTSTTFRTDDWDEADEALRQLADQSLLDSAGPNFVPNRDVRYSLGMGD